MSYATRTRSTQVQSPRGAANPTRQPPGGGGSGGNDDDGSGNGGGPPGGPPGGNPGGGGGGPPGGPPAPPVPPAHVGPIFALTPARAVGGYIDYTSRHGQRLYESSTAKLGIDFDCNSASLRDFVGLADKRAIECNWKMTTLITVDGVQHDLFEQYGFLTTENIRAHVNTYVGTHTRHAQNAFQMAECFDKTLTESARTRVTTRKEEYTINGMVDGLLFFKAIIKTASIDTRATTTTLRNKLASLDHHMQEVSSNVRTFIVDVKSWQQNLLARGETTNDLMVNIFRGLKACSDANFVRYIARKEDDYNEGQDITVDELLDLAGNKYESLIELGEFNKPTDDQKKILALTAQLAKFDKGGNKKPTNKDVNTKKKGSKKPYDPKTKSNKDKSQSHPGSGSKVNYPEWKTKPPASGEPKTKVVKGRTYHWCKYHTLWTAHAPSDCDKGKETNSGASSTDGGSNLQIDRNLQAIVDEDESSM